MTKTSQLYFGQFSGDAKITQSKNSVIIKYDKSLAIFSILIIIFAFLLTSYVAFTDEKSSSFPLKVIHPLASVVYVYFLIRIVSFILGPLGGIFRTSKRIDVAADLIYADSSTVTSTRVTKLGVAAKFASLAMAGDLTEQGKKSRPKSLPRRSYHGARHL